MPFEFIDLFAGIGGFHGALSAMGGKCVFASEIDKKASRIYELNWNTLPFGDIIPLSEPRVSRKIPRHDVLAAGFPCQPFSKSGHQRGLRDSTQGTLFFNICQILDARKPTVVFLENVRNLAGPNQSHTWRTIIRELRNLGYRVSEIPLIFSPHLLPPEMGGAPQIRERVYIVGTYVGKERAWAESDLPPVVGNWPVSGFDPQTWRVGSYLDPNRSIKGIEQYQLSQSENEVLKAWQEFVDLIVTERAGLRLPGFPLWADHFVTRPRISRDTPGWKRDFLQKNSAFYLQHRKTIDLWFKRWDHLTNFPASWRKFEWQAQDARSIWDCAIHFRPSGIRVKRATYLPALVAITQTSIYGPKKRRLTPDEAKRLQSFPDEFDFRDQSNSESYKQLGNAVSMSAAYYVLRQHILRDSVELQNIAPHLLRSIKRSGEKPLIRCQGH